MSDIIEELVYCDQSSHVLGGLTLKNLPVIQKEKGVPLAMVSGDITIMMVYAGVAHFQWTQFDGTPEQIEQALQARWRL